MRLLFIHPNFPAQCRHLAAWFGSKPDCEVVFATANPRREWTIPGVKKAVYTVKPAKNDPFSQPLFDASAHGLAVLKRCLQLRNRGFYPDVIYGYSGWGGTWFIRDVFPNARFVSVVEWYFDAQSEDSLCGRKTPIAAEYAAHLRLRNTVILHDLASSDQVLTATHWQRQQFPARFRDHIAVVHEGIDTEYFSPQANAALEIPGLALTGEEKIITYANRGMEPYRGFPQFIQALPQIFEKTPDCHVVIAGSDRVCYGAAREDGRSWKEAMLEQVSLPTGRVHFVGSLPYGQYRTLLRHSSVHVYLTRPFVLSWSCLEAMACGCLVVGSDTAPVREVIHHGEHGLLANFFSPTDIASNVTAVLQGKVPARQIRNSARQRICDNFDLNHLLLRQIELLTGTTAAYGTAKIQQACGD
ncbi:MAG TPA: glycosyltransferase [Gammaproteobacteria bacterium]|nr:glycosyltransferase [Gammaproteobacteria bacterium]